LAAITPENVKIKIELFGIFRINRFKVEVRNYPCGVSARQVVEDLRLPENLLGIVVINGVHADVDDILQNDDTLALFPLLDGG
jgi:hypothetical protein